MMFNFAPQVGERVLNRLNESDATRNHAAERQNRVALGKIVRHYQHFAILPESMRCPFDPACFARTCPAIDRWRHWR